MMRSIAGTALAFALVLAIVLTGVGIFCIFSGVPLLVMRAATVLTAQVGPVFPSLSYDTACIDQSRMWTAIWSNQGGAARCSSRPAQTCRGL